MRIVVAAVVAMLAVAPVMADFQTLLTEDDVWKLYSKVEVKLSDMAGDTANLGGGQVGGILNDTLAIGLAGYALINDLDSPDSAFKGLESFDLWYLGLVAEYIFAPAEIVHFSAGALVGYGDLESERVAGGRGQTDFLIIEPTVSGAVNITQTMEVGLSLSYRWTDGADSGGYDDNELEGLAAGLFLRFSEF